MAISVNGILQQWKIDVPEGVYLFEHLLDQRQSDCSFIDRLPFAVSRENSRKFDQIDISFQDVFEGSAAKDDFLQIEKKYRGFMIKLWLYSRLYVELDTETLMKGNINDLIDPPYQRYLTSVSNSNPKTKFVEILEKEELEFWVQLAVRDAAFPVFYFEGYSLLLTPSWSCFIAYLHDPSAHQVVKDIAASEGLFLRQPKVR